jgi:flagellar basal body L-ring protein FlgH
MKETTKNKIIDTIKAHTKKPKDEEKMQALQALSLFEDSKEASVGDLVSMVIDGDKRQRASAVQTLCGVGEKAVDEVIERLCNNEEDLDARMQGITIITEILGQSMAKEKAEGKSEEHAEHEHDPHGLGPIMRSAFKKILKEALEEIGEEKKSE